MSGGDRSAPAPDAGSVADAGSEGATGPMTWEDFRERTPARPGERIARRDGPGIRGELRLPAGGGPHPVAVIVHGGCWSDIANASYMADLAEALTSFGWATWLPEFLRLGDAGAAWPGMLEDVGRALDRVRALASDHPLDVTRVVTVGHSSGGHLALWLAGRPHLNPDGDGARLRGDDPVRPCGVIGVAPITDLRDFHAREDRGCPRTAVSDLLGGTPDAVPSRAALADPGAGRPIDVPCLLVTGALDDTVPTPHARTWARDEAKAGEAVRVVEVAGAGHFELVAPEHPTWSARTGPEIRAFLARFETPG